MPPPPRRPREEGGGRAKASCSERQRNKHSLCVGWRNMLCANYTKFFENHQFHVIYCVTLAYNMYYRLHTSAASS